MTILIVDDEQLYCLSVTEVLTELGFTVHCEYDGLCNALLVRLKVAAEHIRSSQALELAFTSPLHRPSANCDEFKELI